MSRFERFAWLAEKGFWVWVGIVIGVLLVAIARADATLTINGTCFIEVPDNLEWVCYQSSRHYGSPTSLAEAAEQCKAGGVVAAASTTAIFGWQVTARLVQTACPDTIAPKPATKIKWVAPTTNEDGSELDDLAGFRVYCNGAEWDIDDPAATTWPLDDSLQGEITCDVAAKDTSGNVGMKGNQAKGER